MLQFEGKKGVEFCDGLTRRDFLRAGALGAGAVGLTLADLHRLGAADTGKGPATWGRSTNRRSSSAACARTS